MCFSEVIWGGLGIGPPEKVGSELSCALPFEAALEMLSSRRLLLTYWVVCWASCLNRQVLTFEKVSLQELWPISQHTQQILVKLTFLYSYWMRLTGLRPLPVLQTLHAVGHSVAEGVGKHKAKISAGIGILKWLLLSTEFVLGLLRYFCFF